MVREGVKLQTPGVRNLLYLFKDRDVAPLATPPDPKTAQSSSSGSLGGSLFLQQSLLLVLWGENPGGNKPGPCWRAHTAVPGPQDRTLGSLRPLARGETLAAVQTLKPVSLLPANSET